MSGPRISVVTPEFCLHVLDLWPDGAIPVRLVRTERVTGLLDANGRADILASLDAARFQATLPPPGFAETLRDVMSRRWDNLRADEGLEAGTPATLLFSGWGKKPDYGDVAFRYTITNWEHDEDVVTDEYGVSLQFATYGGDYKHVGRASDRPFSVTIGGLGEGGERIHDKADAIARAIKRGRRADEVAMTCKALIDTWRNTAPDRCGPGVVLVNLSPDGTVEAAAIDGNGARGVQIPAFP